MSIIEDFKLDMADELEISFAEANTVFSILISLAQEQAPGRIARQRLVNAFAKALQNDREECESSFTDVLNNKAQNVKYLEQLEGKRAVKRANNNFKKIDKAIGDLYKMTGIQL